MHCAEDAGTETGPTHLAQTHRHDHDHVSSHHAGAGPRAWQHRMSRQTHAHNRATRP